MSTFKIIAVPLLLGVALVGSLFITTALADVDFRFSDIINVVNYVGARYSSQSPGYAPGIIGQRGRGTVAAPEVVQNGDQLFRMRAYGYDGQQLQIAGELAFEVDGTPGLANMPGSFFIRLTGTDPSILIEGLRLNQNSHAPAPGGIDVYFGRDMTGERFTDIPTSAPHFVSYRYRGTKMAPRSVQNGDHLGTLRFYGYDGTDLVEGADITVEVDGIPGLNDMPTRIVFWVTPDGGKLFIPAMWITNARDLVIPKMASPTGLSFVCVDGAGKLSSQVVACK